MSAAAEQRLISSMRADAVEREHTGSQKDEPASRAAAHKLTTDPYRHDVAEASWPMACASEIGASGIGEREFVCVVDRQRFAGASDESTIRGAFANRSPPEGVPEKGLELPNEAAVAGQLFRRGSVRSGHRPDRSDEKHDRES